MANLLSNGVPRMLRAVALRILARLVYWLVVVAVSVVLLVLLVSFFESRDESQLDAGFALLADLRSSAGSFLT
jgi:hypothetical protein